MSIESTAPEEQEYGEEMPVETKQDEEKGSSAWIYLTLGGAVLLGGGAGAYWYIFDRQDPPSSCFGMGTWANSNVVGMMSCR